MVAARTTPKDPEKRSEKGSEKGSEKILAWLRNHPEWSARELGESLAIFSWAVEKHLQALKHEGLIRRIGPDPKRGRWEVVE